MTVLWKKKKEQVKGNQGCQDGQGRLKCWKGNQERIWWGGDQHWTKTSRKYSSEPHGFLGEEPLVHKERSREGPRVRKACADKESAAAKSLQWCLTLCDPIDRSPPGSPVPRILHARTLEWAAISFSNAWKWKVKVKSLRRVRLFTIPWTAAYQAPPSVGFSRQEYWSGVPLPSPIETVIR